MAHGPGLQPGRHQEVPQSRSPFDLRPAFQNVDHLPSGNTKAWLPWPETRLCRAQSADVCAVCGRLLPAGMGGRGARSTLFQAHSFATGGLGFKIFLKGLKAHPSLGEHSPHLCWRGDNVELPAEVLQRCIEPFLKVHVHEEGGGPPAFARPRHKLAVDLVSFPVPRRCVCVCVCVCVCARAQKLAAGR